MSRISVDNAYDVARWYEELRATTNSAFLGLYDNQSRYLVLMGGGGSGKSIFAGRKILERVTSERGHRILVLRKVAKTIKESCFRQLVTQIADHYDYSRFKINATDMSITAPNGSQIIFAGLDDVEKLKSIYAITGIWVEEASEITEGDFNQIDIRLRGESTYYKQIILTFNPISLTHWLKAKFFDRTADDCTTSKTTYKDNRFLDDAAKRVLEAYKDTDEYYYNVYCLGEWGVTGKTVFDGKIVSGRLIEVQPAQRTGIFEYVFTGLTIGKYAFSDTDNGYIKIYREPRDGIRYVIGADTAGEGSDYFGAHVIDNMTGEQVAVLHVDAIDEDEFTHQLYCLGKYYNYALIGVEANFSSYPIKTLEKLGYYKQYLRERFDTLTKRNAKAYGFKTTAITRPIIIAELIKIVRESVHLINDKATLEEMLTFIKNDKGRAEAEQGAHDDLVMSLAIAYEVRHQEPSSDAPEQSEPTYSFASERPRADYGGRGQEIIPL